MPSEDFNDFSEKLSPENRLLKNINKKTDALKLSLTKVTPLLTSASKKMVNALINESKILICANGASTSLAQYLAAELINRFETERPALPAFSLTADNIVTACIANDANSEGIFSRQIQALGKSQDILFILVSQEFNNSLAQAIEVAHELGMQIILICGEISEDISPHLNKTDIAIDIALENQALILEAQLISVHSICDLIDHLLFGTT
jgi:D-sedoheptulose 7-phosphate isomerase